MSTTDTNTTDTNTTDTNTTDSAPLVVIDPYAPGAFFAPACRERGIPCVAVVTTPQPPVTLAASWKPEQHDEVVRFDGDARREADVDALAARLAPLRPLAVVAGVETGVALADRLSARLRPDRGNDPVGSAVRRDKAAMHEALAAAGLPHLSQVCSADPAEVERALAQGRLGSGPLVVKPAASAGTDTVTLVPGPGPELWAAFTALLDRHDAFGEANDRVLVQEFAAGTEFTVDTFTADGEHTVCCVTRYTKRNQGGSIGIYDTVDFLGAGAEECAVLLPYARQVLDALGVRFGAAHLEIMLRPEGPVLIELNARPGGGRMVPLSRIATGSSSVDRLVGHLVGDPRPADFPAELKQQVMSVFVSAERDGVVRNAEVFDEIPSLPTLLDSTLALENGRQVARTTDLFTPLGRVVLAHPDRALVEADRHRVRAMEQRLLIG